jgi:hypothetical protein
VVLGGCLGSSPGPDPDRSWGCHVPEPLFSSTVSPLFIRAHETVHSKKDTLQFQAFIKIIEIHDFSIPSPDDGYSSGSSDSGADGHLGDGPGNGLSQPWP